MLVGAMATPQDALNDLKLISVGVFAHNEAATIGQCIKRLLSEEPPDDAILAELIVVVSGDDASEEVARGIAAADDRVRVIRQCGVDGKAHAINMFLAMSIGDVLVLSSADVLIKPGTLRCLLAPFDDDSVGMTGGLVRPLNRSRGFTNRLVHLLWDVHHFVATRTPKLGECVAIRHVFDSIDERSTVDEISLEAEVANHGLELRYVPTAVIYNQGPSCLPDYIRHRLRIHRGHMAVADSVGYSAATFKLSSVMASTLGFVIRKPWRIPLLVAAVWIEMAVRSSARFAYMFAGHPQRGCWLPIQSAKTAEFLYMEDLELAEVSTG